MELRNYLTILNRRKLIVLICLLAALASGYLWLRHKPTASKTVLSVITNYHEVEDKTQEEFFKYNNYYGTLIAQSFNESVSGLLKNAGVVAEVFAKADMSALEKNIKNPAKYFKTVPKSNHVSEITFYADTSPEAEKLTDSLIAILGTKADEFVMSQGEGELSLGIEGPVITEKKPPLLLYLVIIGIVSLGFGVGLAILVHYLSDEVTCEQEFSQTIHMPILAVVKANRSQLPESGQYAESFIFLRDQILTELSPAHAHRIGIAGSHVKTSSNIIANLDNHLKGQKTTELTDISKTHPDQALEILHKTDKHKGQIDLVLLPALFGEKQNIDYLNYMDYLLIVLPCTGLKRSYLKALANLLTQFKMPKGLVLTR